ncbi:MAG: phage portal protein [Deltaproteobacteria bacterium]|nr:phage portal protein [Deltaproteobacteria bacterium]
MMDATHQDLFARAVSALALGMGRKPALYDHQGRPMRPSASYQYRRTAAKREGSLQNWIPQRILNRQTETLERERIVERSIDLTNNDPHAAGIVDNFATTVVGAGLRPHPTLDAGILGLGKEEVRRLQARMGAVFEAWSPWADAAGRMTDGGIQFLLQCNMVQFGEFIVVLPMIRDIARPYSLAAQVIHPLRLKTPSDFYAKQNIRDGVELGGYGQPEAYWIKKTDPNDPLRHTADISQNFLRIPARKGHRWNVIHRFIQREPEQVRGWPFFAPAMKFFRDLNDYLDAELVANVVTAAYALFIESGELDPWTLAEGMAHHTDLETGKDEDRYEELIPGQIMYGKKGQKPHPIAANRPGTTFQVFVKEIKKALAMSLNMPYVSLFKDVENTSYAGFRSALLDAWRVLSHRRSWLGENYGRPVRTMLLEEAWLRGDLPEIEDFYGNMHALSACQWLGSPKGNIEPVKEIQADILAIKNNLKTRAETIAEQNGDWRRTFEQLEEEKEDLEGRGLDPGLEEGPTRETEPMEEQ